MVAITIQADSAADVRELLAGFSPTAVSESALMTLLTDLAHAVMQGRNEQTAQLEQMRLFQANLKETIMFKLDDLIDKVNEQSSTVESVAAFIAGLESSLTEALQGADPATQEKISAIMTKLDEQKQALADAIDNDPSTPAQAGGDGTGEPV